MRTWNRDDPKSLAPLLTLLNNARHTHPALQKNSSLCFHAVGNDRLIAYSKREGDDVVLAIVNLDPENFQSGWTNLDLVALNLSSGATYSAQDLLSGEVFQWTGARNYVALDPEKSPAHLLVLRKQPLSDSLAGESTED